MLLKHFGYSSRTFSHTLIRINYPTLTCRYYSKQSAINLSVGDYILHKGKIMEITSSQHVRHAQSKGLVQTEMRDLLDGKKREERFKSSEQVEVIEIETVKCKFVKRNKKLIECNSQSTYETINVDENLLEHRAYYLTLGTELLLKIYEGKQISASFFKPSVAVKVQETQPFSKHDQESPRYKPALLENGRRVKVPPYVNSGDVIVLDVNTENFQSRSNETEGLGIVGSNNKKKAEENDEEEDEEEDDEEEGDEEEETDEEKDKGKSKRK